MRWRVTRRGMCEDEQANRNRGNPGYEVEEERVRSAQVKGVYGFREATHQDEPAEQHHCIAGCETDYAECQNPDHDQGSSKFGTPTPTVAQATSLENLSVQWFFSRIRFCFAVRHFVSHSSGI